MKAKLLNTHYILIVIFIIMSSVFRCEAGTISGLTKTIIGNPSVLNTGQNYTYQITIESLSANDKDLLKITDNIDPRLQIIGEPITSNMVFTYTRTGNNILLEHKFGNDFGTYGNITVNITVQVIGNMVCDGDLIQNTAYAEITGHNSINASVSARAKVINLWKIEKRFAGIQGDILTYFVDVYLPHNNTIGGQDLHFVELSDNLDFSSANGVIQSITSEQCNVNSGLADLPGTLAIWAPIVNGTEGILPAGGDGFFRFAVKVKLTCTENVAGTIQKIINNVDFSAYDKCNNKIKLTANNIGNIAFDKNCTPIEQPANFDTLEVRKTVTFQNEYGMARPGCTGKYSIKVKNVSDNLILHTILIDEDFPAELLINDIEANIDGITIDNLNNFSNGMQLPVQDASFNDQSFLIKRLGDLQPNQSFTIDIFFTIPNTTLPSTIFKNCANFKVKYRNSTIPSILGYVGKQSTCASFTIVPDKPTYHLNKFISTNRCENDLTKTCDGKNRNSFLPGDKVHYKFDFFNFGLQASNKEVVINDLLPESLKLIPGSMSIKSMITNKRYDPCASYDDLRAERVYNLVEEKERLSFSIEDNIPGFICQGLKHYIIEFDATVMDDAQEGQHNNMYSLKDDQNVNYSNNAPFSIDYTKGVFLQKSILSNTVSRNIGTIVYQIKVKNLSNTIMTDLEIIDELPRLNDASGNQLNLNFVGCTASQFSNSNNNVNVSISKLDPCKEVVFTITASYVVPKFNEYSLTDCNRFLLKFQAYGRGFSFNSNNICFTIPANPPPPLSNCCNGMVIKPVLPRESARVLELFNTISSTKPISKIRVVLSDINISYNKEACKNCTDVGLMISHGNLYTQSQNVGTLTQVAPNITFYNNGVNIIKEITYQGQSTFLRPTPIQLAIPLPIFNTTFCKAIITGTLTYYITDKDCNLCVQEVPFNYDYQNYLIGHVNTTPLNFPMDSLIRNPSEPLPTGGCDNCSSPVPFAENGSYTKGQCVIGSNGKVFVALKSTRSNPVTNYNTGNPNWQICGEVNCGDAVNTETYVYGRAYLKGQSVWYGNYLYIARRNTLATPWNHYSFDDMQDWLLCATVGGVR